jgi:predicted nucleotidyltransferase
MRLTQAEQSTIRHAALEIFGPQITVRLFGSRVDDAKRGGDIDLLVEAPAPVAQKAQKTLRLVAELQLRLGDQPIDVLVVDPDTTMQPVHKVAQQTGVLL